MLHWREKLHRSLHSRPEHPIFLALSHTIRTFRLPVQWLDDLLSAFLMDLTKNRFRNWEEVYYYCKHSANPIGRIILWMFGYRQEKLFQYSDSITTALQLVNFWQDLSVDIPRNRLYIPLEVLQSHGIPPAVVLRRELNSQFGPVLKELVGTTRELFRQGRVLLSHVRGRLQWELRLTVLGGIAVLNKVERNSGSILWRRPTLTRSDWVRISFQLIK